MVGVVQNKCVYHKWMKSNVELHAQEITIGILYHATERRKSHIRNLSNKYGSNKYKRFLFEMDGIIMSQLEFIYIFVSSQQYKFLFAQTKMWLLQMTLVFLSIYFYCCSSARYVCIKHEFYVGSLSLSVSLVITKCSFLTFSLKKFNWCLQLNKVFEMLNFLILAEVINFLS